MLNNIVLDCLNWAGNHHAYVGQKYDHLPYYTHLVDVVNILDKHNFSQELQSAAACHDLLEDTNLSYKDLSRILGDDVADIVYDVTNELGKNRKERAEKTYPKIAANPKAIVVKLADRIANTNYSSESQSNMYKKYCKEYREFREKLYTKESISIYPELQKMWTALEVLSVK